MTSNMALQPTAPPRLTFTLGSANNMRRILIAYSTVDGHTAKISGRVAQVLGGLGHHVELMDICQSASVDVASFDQVIIGASIRYGKYRSELYRFIDANRQTLDQKANAFFSVNLVARKPEKDSPQSNPYMKAFQSKTTWKPREMAVFAGKLDYPSYSFLSRCILRLIMWMSNGPTDPTVSVDFTDWKAVESFSYQLAKNLKPGKDAAHLIEHASDA